MDEEFAVILDTLDLIDHRIWIDCRAANGDWSGNAPDLSAPLVLNK